MFDDLIDLHSLTKDSIYDIHTYICKWIYSEKKILCYFAAASTVFLFYSVPYKSLTTPLDFPQVLQLSSRPGKKLMTEQPELDMKMVGRKRL